MSSSFKKLWKRTRKALSDNQTTFNNVKEGYNTAAEIVGLPPVPGLEFTSGQGEGLEEEEDTHVSGDTKEHYIKKLSATAYALLEKDSASTIRKLSQNASQDERQYIQDVRNLQMKYSEALRFVKSEIEIWGNKSTKSDVSELAMTLSPMFDNWKLGVVMPSSMDQGDRVSLRITSSAAELITLDGAEFCTIEAEVIDRLGLRNEEAYTKYSDRTVTASVPTKSASSQPSAGIGGRRYEEL